MRLFFAVMAFSIGLTSPWAAECAYNPEKTRISRVVAINPTRGETAEAGSGNALSDGAGLPLALNDKEVVLVFDHAPGAAYTKNVLDILDHDCVKATFFFEGRSALNDVTSVRDVVRRGNTFAANPWLPNADLAKVEIEKAKADVERALALGYKVSDSQVAPFIHLGSGELPGDLPSYLRERGISVWRHDISSGDIEPGLTATQLANRTLLKIHEMKKGIVLFHDSRKVTVDALDSILNGMKLGGYRVVHIVPRDSFEPKKGYLASVAEPSSSVGSANASRRLLDAARRKVRADYEERRLRVLREAQ